MPSQLSTLLMRQTSTSSSSSGITMDTSIGVPLASLGPATTPESEVVDTTARRNWYIPGVFPSDDLLDKLNNEYDPKLTKFPFRTKWCVRKFEIAPETGKLHGNYCMVLDQAKTFAQMADIFAGMGFLRPQLSWFKLADKKTIFHNIQYVIKEHTAAPGDIGIPIYEGNIGNDTIPQWLQSYEDKEERKKHKVNDDKKSAKEEARDFLKPFIAQLQPWENLNDLRAMAADDEALSDVLCLHVVIAKELLSFRDAKARSEKRERKGLFILIGAAGSAKTTRCANDGRPENMPVDKFLHLESYDEDYSKYSNNYRVGLDEFSGTKMPYDRFKLLTDNNNSGGRYERPVKNKEPVEYNHAEVWAMSNRDPCTWYPKLWKSNPNELDAFIRRVQRFEVAPRWRVTNIHDPTSVVYDDDGTPQRNIWSPDGPEVQYMDITEKFKDVRSLKQFRELTLWYRDQLPDGHPLGLSNADRIAIDGSRDPWEHHVSKRPRDEQYEHGLFKYARTGH